MNFVIFPMFFASSALYPLWRVREASPLLYEICRAEPVHLCRRAHPLRALRSDRRAPRGRKPRPYQSVCRRRLYHRSSLGPRSMPTILRKASSLGAAASAEAPIETDPARKQEAQDDSNAQKHDFAGCRPSPPRASLGRGSPAARGWPRLPPGAAGPDAMTTEPVPPASPMSTGRACRARSKRFPSTQVLGRPADRRPKGLEQDREIVAREHPRYPASSGRGGRGSDKDIRREAAPEGKRDGASRSSSPALFENVNNQRTVVHGITRYQKSQVERSAELSREENHIAELETRPRPDEKAEPRSTTPGTSSPGPRASSRTGRRTFRSPASCRRLIEERLYALAHAIRAEMKS